MDCGDGIGHWRQDSLSAPRRVHRRLACRPGNSWGENAGWMKLGSGSGPYANTTPANYGVNQDISGSLTGYAWSENAGWIRFEPVCVPACPGVGVTLDGGTLQFTGYAWAENAG